MTRRKTSTLTIVTFRVVEETDDDRPSLPPFPIDVEGSNVSETIRPLAKAMLKVSSLRRLG